MGITLDADLYLLCSMFNINYRKLSDEYSGLSVEEIMKKEAKQGNTAAANFDASILGNPIKFIELFGLQNCGNKYAILSNMNEYDLKELLPLLNQADLVAGLNFFTKDKLIDLIGGLPIEQLVKLTFEMFSPEQLMQYMPEDQLNKVLTSPDMDKDLEIKYLQTLKPEILAQMLEAATGQPVSGSQDVGLDGKADFNVESLMKQISELPDDKFREAMMGIPLANKQNFVLKMAKENPKIFQLFDASAYTNIIDHRRNKEDIVKASIVIQHAQLVEMIKELPRDLTAVVLTQIDTKKFADVLLKSFKNIISQIIAG